MASQLARAHIEGERRLRVATAAGVGRIWRALPGYDREHVDQWLSQVLPLVVGAQRRSIALTEAYLGRALDRPPFGLDVDELIRGVRRGADPAGVYGRPFVTTWTALKAGSLYEDAVASGMARAAEMARFDVQGAMRSTADAVQREAGIVGYERVADADACPFCAELDGVFVKSADAMGLHPGCGCGLEPVTAETRGARRAARDEVATHQHGEMGAVISSPDHDFTTESQALA